MLFQFVYIREIVSMKQLTTVNEPVITVFLQTQTIWCFHFIEWI